MTTPGFTKEFVKARLVETAEIERRIPAIGLRPATAHSLQLPYVHSFAEMVGWGEERRREHIEEIMENWRTRLSAKEITRHDQTVRWVSEHVFRDEDRIALWAWARSKAGGRPFDQWCRRSGFSDTVGKKRFNRAIENIWYGVRKSGEFATLDIDIGGSPEDGFGLLEYASRE